MLTKAAVVLNNEQPFVIKQINVAAPKHDEILVKIVATGVCHTDAVAKKLTGVVPMPVILGHEGSGIVEQVGDGVKNLKKGDHVILSFATCHQCENCLTGHPSSCDDFNLLNFGGRLSDGSTPYQLDGKDLSVFFGQSSFSQYVTTKAINAIQVDSDVDIALLGPLGCGIQTGAGTILNKLKPGVNESIAIFGSGAVGLSAIMAAKLTGAYPIIAVDVHESRLQLAKELGATHCINGAKQDAVEEIRALTGKGTRYTLETTGVAPVVKQAVASVRPLGTIAIIAFTGEVSFNIQQEIMAEGKTLVGVIEGDSIPNLFIPKLVNLYKQGLFPFDKLVKFYPLEEINQAFADSASGKVIKPIVTMS